MIRPDSPRTKRIGVPSSFMGYWVARVLGCATVAALGLSAPKALAQGTPRVHDDVFFHFGVFVGPSWLDYDATMTTGTRHEGGATDPTSGGFELALGGTPADGFVLAAIGVVNVQTNPSFEDTGVLRNWEDSFNGFSTFAALARYYLQPANGFYGEFLVGPVAHLTHVERTIEPNPLECIFGPTTCIPKKVEDEERSHGIGLGAGTGYEFWVGKKWSVGPTARFQFAHTWSSQGTYSFFIATLGFAATMH